MAEPFILRKGEAHQVHLGPDPWVFLATGDRTDRRFDLFEGTVTYHQGPPLHVHEDQDDTLLVVSGVLKVQVADEMFDLGPGDLAHAPPGVPHTFANLEQEPVRVISVMTPGGFDATLEYAASWKGPPGEAEIAELESKHRIRIVGPPIPVTLGLL